MLNPVALKIATLLPTPAGQCGQVAYGILGNSNESIGVVRADYQISQKNSMFGRYIIADLEGPGAYDGKDALTFNNADHAGPRYGWRIGRYALVRSQYDQLFPGARKPARGSKKSQIRSFPGPNWACRACFRFCRIFPASQSERPPPDSASAQPMKHPASSTRGRPRLLPTTSV